MNSQAVYKISKISKKLDDVLARIEDLEEVRMVQGLTNDQFLELRVLHNRKDDLTRKFKGWIDKVDL